MLSQDAARWLARDHGEGLPFALSFSSDMRYRGQSFEIEVPLQTDWVRDGDLAAIRAAFDAQHERLFAHADPAAPVQMINLRLVITSPTAKPRLVPIAAGSGSPTPRSEVSCYLDGANRNVPLYRREDFLAGQSIAGPAIVAQDDTTTCVPPGMRVDVDRYGNLVITPGSN
jgi:N-methylhydantoinase A